jgi:hypothetical protein
MMTAPLGNASNWLTGNRLQDCHLLDRDYGSFSTRSSIFGGLAAFGDCFRAEPLRLRGIERVADRT